MGTPIHPYWILGLLGLIVMSAVFVLVAAVLSARKDQTLTWLEVLQTGFFLKRLVAMAVRSQRHYPRCTAVLPFVR